MELKKELSLNNGKYEIQFKASDYAHLCTFKELTDVSLTIHVKNETFKTIDVKNNKFSTQEIAVFRSMFVSLINKRLAGYRGLLYACPTSNTGSYSFQTEEVLPMLEGLTIHSSMELYTEDSEDSEGTEMDYVMTLTNLDIQKSVSFICKETEAYIEANTLVVKHSLTVDCVNNYLKGL